MLSGFAYALAPSVVRHGDRIAEGSVATNDGVLYLAKRKVVRRKFRVQTGRRAVRNRCRHVYFYLAYAYRQSPCVGQSTLLVHGHLLIE